MIKSDGPGRLTTTTETQDHTEWPCVPKGHPKDVPCEEAIASYAARQGAHVIRDEKAPSQP